MWALYKWEKGNGKKMLVYCKMERVDCKMEQEEMVSLPVSYTKELEHCMTEVNCRNCHLIRHKDSHPTVRKILKLNTIIKYVLLTISVIEFKTIEIILL